MPSISSLLKHRSESQNENRMSLSLSVTPEKLQRKSKRNFFRNLFKISSFSSKDKPGKEQSVVTYFSIESPTIPIQTPTTNPSSPMSNHNKPLPPPPPSIKESASSEAISSRPYKKLDRIISPLTDQELRELFSGAPQFYARSEGHHTGAPYPKIAFPWDSSLQIRDLSDHVQIQDEAWGCITAWPHITREAPISLEGAKVTEKRRAHFMPRCRERPNMLSMQGIEKGTVGYQAALELGVADALNEPEEIQPDSGLYSLFYRRRGFANGKDGIRPLDESAVYEHLMDIGVSYHEDQMHSRSTVELYSELFTQILFPPSRVTDTDDPYSLQVQIENPSWTDTMGQQLESDLGDGISSNSESTNDPEDQKYWLLLQILLSCELLVRLDTVSQNIDNGLEPAKPADVKKLEKSMTPSVKWSLILARSWLENIRIEQSIAEIIPERKASGWLASLTGASASIENSAPPESVQTYQFRGRNETRQLAGLLHFAQKLKWPHLDKLNAKVSSNDIYISDSIQNTPSTGTPMSVSTQKTSYFMSQRPVPRRGLSRSTQRMSALINSSGWLSNSYISGLMLPGEGLSHFLISTLLENDDAAVEKLGDEANLYGGFVFGQRSFWSTACIIGRVLAADKNSSECMGWISSDVKPRGISGEAWVNIDVDTASVEDATTDTPRILQKAVIERDGSVIGGADPSSILPGDFVAVYDSPTLNPPSITFESLDLFAVDSDETTPTEEEPTPQTELSTAPSIKTYSAMMRFLLSLDGDDKKEINVALTHDIHFVTAHPCVKSHSIEVLKSPTSPLFRQNGDESDQIPNPNMGHPLHKAFTYTIIPLQYILTSPASKSLSSLLISPPRSPVEGACSANIQASTHTTTSNIPKVLVIDCASTILPPSPPDEVNVNLDLEVEIGSGGRKKEFGSDAEMLVRALCAERGWNALISRKGRGCLACAVREAGAIGWGVVIRV
ncbi:putative helicase-like protein [Botrytis fragariae]|uniref:Putative helicase-like protein n=1 Tax=Botrytis fragariae TaxID=1964551 RepID=A0A8H6AT38_9HELO|nr:putative helicase-like protein [Botrytis fragariae]KAF5873102.1 putative helicase-like protein [Botrytis fragariae]